MSVRFDECHEARPRSLPSGVHPPQPISLDWPVVTARFGACSKPAAMARQRMPKIFENVQLLLRQEQFAPELAVFGLQFCDTLGKQRRFSRTILFLPIPQIPDLDAQFRGNHPCGFASVEPPFDGCALEVFVVLLSSLWRSRVDRVGLLFI